MKSETPSKKPAFELSADTRFLYEILSNTRPGEQVTYQQLGAAVARPIVGGDPHLQSALARTFRDDGAVFDNIRGIGYRRLTDAEIVQVSARDLDRLRRRSRRYAEKLTKVEHFEALPQQRRVEHNARLSIFSAIVSLTKARATKRVEDLVTVTGRELPFAETLAAFSPKSKE